MDRQPFKTDQKAWSARLPRYVLDALLTALTCNDEPSFPLLEELILEIFFPSHSLAAREDALAQLAKVLCDSQRYPRFRRIAIALSQDEWEMASAFKSDMEVWGMVPSYKAWFGDGACASIRALLAGFAERGVEVDVAVRDMREHRWH